uniref:Synaptotagmin n=1 Tax=Panagrellus redivivus TaxID=6233 RepID=A0A7E4ZPS7_PANRE
MSPHSENEKKTSFQTQVIMAAVMATAVGISFVIVGVTIFCAIRCCLRYCRKHKKTKSKTASTSSQLPTSQAVTSLPQSTSKAPSTKLLGDPSPSQGRKANHGMPGSETQLTGESTGGTTKKPKAIGTAVSMPDEALDKTQSLKASNESKKKVKKESERNYKVVEAPDNLDNLGPLSVDPPTTRAQVISGAIDNSSLIDQFNF